MMTIVDFFRCCEHLNNLGARAYVSWVPSTNRQHFATGCLAMASSDSWPSRSIAFRVKVRSLQKDRA
jgi:hypothetical protein